MENSIVSLYCLLFRDNCIFYFFNKTFFHVSVHVDEKTIVQS